jgi:transcriptional regulator GlxA family with amidase domain
MLFISLGYACDWGASMKTDEFPSWVKPKLIGILGFDGVSALDLIGTSEAFCTANNCAENQFRPYYDVRVIAVKRKAFVSEAGVILKARHTLSSAPNLDTVIVPGGRGARPGETCQTLARWFAVHSSRIKRFAAISSGVYPLAQSGLLDGRKATTHYRDARDVARRFPKIEVSDKAIFIKDDQFYTSAGATAGIDLALSLIEEDYGQRVSLAVARDLIVYLKRPGSQEQYSEPLRFQAESVSRFSELTTWIYTHLNEDLSVDALAARACLCQRHFSRRFKADVGTSSADFVERLRLNEACRRLSNSDNSVENIGLSVGFKSADAFRRAFERRLEINPSDYRRRFNTWKKTDAAPPPPQLNKVSIAA